MNPLYVHHALVLKAKSASPFSSRPGTNIVESVNKRLWQHLSLNTGTFLGLLIEPLYGHCVLVQDKRRPVAMAAASIRSKARVTKFH